MEEAIAQLKSLAVHGHNVYQQPDMNSSKLYEFIWLNENDNTIAAPVRICPTSGHNLSIITEVSESNSTSSTRSKSSLVQTVDAIMDKSACDASIEDDHLTYVEISFLSKLSESSAIESDISVELTPDGSQSNRPARRQFSIIRDKFEEKKSNERAKKQDTKLSKADKENISTESHTLSIKTEDSASPVRKSVQRLKKQTLSPESRIFSQSILKH